MPGNVSYLPEGRRYGTPSDRGPRHRAGSRLPSVRVQPRHAARPARLRQEPDGQRPDRSRRRAAGVGVASWPNWPNDRRRWRTSSISSWEQRAPRGERQFRIESSEADAASPVFISPDVATCPDCLAELLDPADRRYGYPFLNCTNCGPRLTIITGAPYDRQRTTMAAFAMCAACRAEYDDPAQPPLPRPADRLRRPAARACSLLDAAGQPIAAADPLAVFAAALCAGQIGALKGSAAITWPAMHGTPRPSPNCGGASTATRSRSPSWSRTSPPPTPSREVGPVERALLLSPSCPIVLLNGERPASAAGEEDATDAGRSPEEVAPGNPWLGVMLPYTPLHHLLLRAVGGIPLVMTSGNRSDEPIAYQDDAVRRSWPASPTCSWSTTGRSTSAATTRSRASSMASSCRCGARAATPPGRSSCRWPVRGRSWPSGGQLKATFALGRGRQAFLSHHLGDLDHYDAYRAFEKDVALYQQLFAVTPRVPGPRSASRLRHDPLRAAAGGADGNGAARRSASPCAHGELHGGARTDGAGHRRHVRRHRLRHRRRRLGRRVPRRRLPAVPAGGASALRRHAGRRPGHPRAVAHGGGPSRGRRRSSSRR